LFAYLGNNGFNYDNYGMGLGYGNGWGLETEAVACHEQEQSALVTLPPLATIWLAPET